MFNFDFVPVEIVVPLLIRGEQHHFFGQTLIGNDPEEVSQGAAILVFYRNRVALSQFHVQFVKQCLDGGRVDIFGLEASCIPPVFLEKRAGFKE